MRLIGRNDAFLLVGLAVALFVVFSRTIAGFLDFVREVEQASGLLLTPALIILAGVFVFHLLRKRHASRTEALTLAAEARQANARAAEMERLVAFGHALARALDGEAIRQAVTEHLPQLTHGRTAWTMVRVAGEWHCLAHIGNSRSEQVLQEMADRAIGPHGEAADGDDVCFPLVVGDSPVGVLGVGREPTLHDDQRRALSAAAALLAVSIKNAELFREIHEHSVRDALTGCFNRRHSLEVLDGELRRAKRSHLPLSLIMFDLDHFKEINDRHGHLCGDAVLATVGHRMRAVLRGSDVKCRYGGEEFLVILPDTPLGGAQRVADTIRNELASQPVAWNGSSVSLSASFGVTAISPGEVVSAEIIGRADAALYQAKQSGRNCIRTANDDARMPGS